MLEAKSRGGRGERSIHDEEDIDEEIKRLLGRKRPEGPSLSPLMNRTPAMEGPARDAAVELLKKVRPAVASIEDRATRARVTDALLSAVRGQDVMSDIAKAAMDSAQANAQRTKRTTYEQICADSEAAYAARNPHKREDK